MLVSMSAVKYKKTRNIVVYDLCLVAPAFFFLVQDWHLNALGRRVERCITTRWWRTWIVWRADGSSDLRTSTLSVWDRTSYHFHNSHTHTESQKSSSWCNGCVSSLVWWMAPTTEYLVGAGRTMMRKRAEPKCSITREWRVSKRVREIEDTKQKNETPSFVVSRWPSQLVAAHLWRLQSISIFLTISSMVCTHAELSLLSSGRFQKSKSAQFVLV